MKRILKNALFIALFIFIALFVMNTIYIKIGYGYFKKALSRSGVTFFTRDNKVKYSDMNSYKIENKDYNNATFYKKIKVNKNTPYKITCMVKTENVEVLDKSYKNSGAKISILDTEDQSISISGTKDWQKITLLLNSKQNEELSIGFMLGGDSKIGNVKGTAWFSDLTIEEGTIDDDNNWNFVCFIFKNTNVALFDSQYKYSMTAKDIVQINDCMERFKNTCSEISNNSMTATYKIVEIDKAITELSYDDKRGYYIGPENISQIIDPYLEQENYDHIFVCTRLNDSKSSIPIKNWIGLGGMEYKGKGFSNIRMPTKMDSIVYTYDEEQNPFPEEVFIHEFLHTLENNSKKYGYSVPELHSNESYCYYEDDVKGLYDWYKAYMSSTIQNKQIRIK